MRRGLTLLKMRGSMHDKEIREFHIDGQGLHIGPPFRNIFGILSGNFTHVATGELERLDDYSGRRGWDRSEVLSRERHE